MFMIPLLGGGLFRAFWAALRMGIHATVAPGYFVRFASRYMLRVQVFRAPKNGAQADNANERIL